MTGQLPTHRDWAREWYIRADELVGPDQQDERRRLLYLAQQNSKAAMREEIRRFEEQARDMR